MKKKYQNLSKTILTMPVSSNSQHQIAEQALKLLFVGEVSLKPLDGLFSIELKGDWRPYKLLDCISYLSERTGSKREIDPFAGTDRTAWVIVSQSLSTARLYNLALYVAMAYLDKCYALQEKHNQRMHKGALLFWASMRFQEIGDIQTACGYMLLALIEDVYYYSEPRVTPAYMQLVSAFDFSLATLDDLIAYVRGAETSFCPETVILEWELENVPEMPQAE